MPFSRRLGAAALVAAALFAPLLAVPSAQAAPADDIRINEIESNGDTQDWIELVNRGSETVDLSGWRLKDNNAGHIVIPSGTTIEADSFLAIDVDVATVPGEFGLGGNDTAQLLLPDNATVVDTHAYTGHAATTYGRCPNGTGAFVVTAASTKGAANACAADPAAVVRINEVESSGGAPVDWIELVNTGLVPADVSGYRLKDNDDARTFTIAPGTTIPAGGFVAIDVDIAEELGGFGLGGTDSARFFEADGTTLIDSHTWSGGHAATTFGRCPDGVGAFAVTAASTKGAANVCPPSAVPSIVINEIESNGGTPGDWVELKNTGAAPVDISGWKVKDNDDTRNVTIPVGTVVAPGGYVLVEESLTGFGLGSPDSFRLYLSDGSTQVDSHSWTPHAATTLARCPDGTGALVVSTSSTKGAANDCGSPIKINEVESSGDTGDWIELRNNGAGPVDASGFVLKGTGGTTLASLPAATTLAAGAYLAVDVTGLGEPGAATLLAADGTTQIDSSSWTVHATTTVGRCPDGTGPFTQTAAPSKGAANVCPGDLVFGAWPGGAQVETVDLAGTYASNLSGLAYVAGETPADDTLWAVQNGPGTLHRLGENDGQWLPVDGWVGGAALHYADGTGDVDAEGVVVVGDDLYVSTERNNAVGVSRPSVLRYDTPTANAPLAAAREWNLAALLPSPIGANAGLEGIAFIPDAVLVDRGLRDASTGAVYDPDDYAGHGGGLFFVGLEANGLIYGVALADDGPHLVTTIDPGLGGIMELEYEPATGGLWAVCDDTCQGRSSVLRIATAGAADGTFVVDAAYERPTGLANLNDEGFAIAPESRCVDGLKPVLWSDDNSTDGHALREGTLPCATDGSGPGGAVPPGAAAGGAAGTGTDVRAVGGGVLPGTGAPISLVTLFGLLMLPVGAAALFAARRSRAVA